VGTVVAPHEHWRAAGKYYGASDRQLQISLSRQVILRIRVTRCAIRAAKSIDESSVPLEPPKTSLNSNSNRSVSVKRNTTTRTTHWHAITPYGRSQSILDEFKRVSSQLQLPLAQQTGA
jgi:hypothetical protein